MRYLLVGAVLGVLVGFVLRSLRGGGPGGADADGWPTDARASTPAPAPSVVDDMAISSSSPPARRVPPSEADPGDREAESEEDEQLKYERFREQEERERADVASRLQSDPLVDELDTDATPGR